jgi:hypothetical protein
VGSGTTEIFVSAESLGETRSAVTAAARDVLVQSSATQSRQRSSKFIGSPLNSGPINRSAGSILVGSKLHQPSAGFAQDGE